MSVNLSAIRSFLSIVLGHRSSFRIPKTQIPKAIVLASLTIGLYAQSPASRDWRYWPFSQTSPWNTPIGSGAKYAPVAALNSLAAQINVTQWTSSVYIASLNDPKGSILFSPASGGNSNYTFLTDGGKTCGNSKGLETNLKADSTPALGFKYNFYSTISAPNTDLWLLPADVSPISGSFNSSPFLPRALCPSPDVDGYLAVFQPNGLVLDTINSVALSDQTIVTAMASYVNSKGDGSGYSNGRRASMIPSFAGLIRNGELGSGLIPHALAVIAPQKLLLAKAVWPATAFDRGAHYSGTLPMGSLLAIPSWIDLDNLGLSPTGKTIAIAAQNFGVYIVDSGGDGLGFLAELNNLEISSTDALWQDLEIITSNLEVVTNNNPATPGGGGTPRAPFAPPFFD